MNNTTHSQRASEKDLEKILEWNQNRVDLPDNLCIHQRIERQAQLTPERIAVSFADQTLTYGQLEERSNQLAHYLMACGVGPDSFVGICIERSLEMIVGILGILKAGGAYIPLDPEYPRERLAYMVDNSGALALLTTTRMVDRLPDCVASTVCIDAQQDQISRQSSVPPQSGVRPDNLIYVIYTSGSTGKPKGTLVYHKGFANLMHWYCTEFDFGADSRVLLMTSTSFDLTQKNIFAPLASGGCLVVLESDIFDAEIIRGTIARETVTSINCTPSAFHGLLQDADMDCFQKIASLKQVFLGGEPIVPAKLRAWRANPHCNAQVVNSYGPTECTDVCAFYRLVDYDRYEKTSVPIGRAIGNTELFIVDKDMHLLAIGEEGELCIGGAGVGAGYLKRDDLTAEKFVQAPFRTHFSGPIYRTGDMVKYLQDGNIAYIGRIDQQVKIRGFRIELGEIEALLEKHPSVREVVVHAHQPPSGEKRLAAYIIRTSDENVSVNALRSYLQNSLPDYMLPTAWMFIDAIPLTPNGKIDRNALPAPDRTRPEITQPYVAPKTGIETALSQIWCEILGFEKVGVNDPFFEMGGTSIQAIQFIAKVGNMLKTSIPIVHFFDFPTISRFVEYLRRNYTASLAAIFPDELDRAIDSPADKADEGHAAIRAGCLNSIHRVREVADDIAIIGMAGKFPGADNKDEFWENLVNGRQASSQVTSKDLEAVGIDPQILNDPSYVDVCYPLKDHDQFDAGFFGYAPNEAQLIDPQQRFFLERAWEVLEDAGYDLQKCKSKVGIFGGIARNGYLVHNIASHKQLRDESGEYQSLMGNEKDFPVTRAAYKLGLTGPAVNVQTACSSSGVALHLACQSLRNGDCDMAIVGGCRVMVPHRIGYRYVQGSAFSADGAIRAFDAAATGMVRGSGGGCILIKRLHNALDDGDHIYAVLKSTAVNNDGADKIGFTAPSIQGQAEVITKALAIAGVAPETIRFVEAHGTGTNLGDPIEVAALTQAYRRYTDKSGFCFIGSVKSNIGHLDAGACVTGIIKTCLAIKHRVIPPQINFSRPNPRLCLEESPFVINTDLKPWHRQGSPRRAAVSSFGLGGSNAHVIIEEPPDEGPSSAAMPWNLFKLSARTEQGLSRYKKKFIDYLDQHPTANIADVCRTVTVGRRDFECRFFSICADVEDLKTQLEEPVGNRTVLQDSSTSMPGIVFMFPGQGAQHVNMGRDLYEHIPRFKQIVDECSQKLAGHLDCDLRDVIYPAEGDSEVARARLTQTRFAQPALFVVEYAMAKLYQSWGLIPSYMIGHSVGEFIAACLADVFTLDDALAIVALRGRLMQSMPIGRMLSVGLPEDDLKAMGLDQVEIAAINTQDRCVVSGTAEAINAFKDKLDRQEIPVRAVVTSHAFHSAMMDPVRKPFAEFLQNIRLHQPRKQIFSCTTGRLLSGEEATNPTYWVDQLRLPVRFAQGLSMIQKEARCTMLEIGPGITLSTFANRLRLSGHNDSVMASWGHPKSGKSSLETSLSVIGKLWLGNAPIDWSVFLQDTPGKRISLPTYPFEGKRYWIEPFIEARDSKPTNSGVATTVEHMVLHNTGQISLDAVSDAIPDEGGNAHRQRICAEVRELVMAFTGFEAYEIEDDLSFLELGLDSIYLTQLAAGLKKAFRIDIQLRQLFEDLTSINQLTDYLSREMPPDPPISQQKFDGNPAPQVVPGASNTPSRDSSMASAMATIVAQPGDQEAIKSVIFGQLRIMEQQLDILKNGAKGADANIPGLPPGDHKIAHAGKGSASAVFDSGSNPLTSTGSERETDTAADKPFGAGVRIKKAGFQGFSEQQQAFLDAFSPKYLAATQASKAYTAKYRRHLADPRAVSGFSLPLKELVYPIVVKRSEGAHVWDIDGNTYIDMTNGFGANLLGHSPPFIQEAIAAQLKAGIEIGPQHPLAGEVAEMICDMTGFERAIFCNTGSEAVMGAMRICRSVNGRDKIVMFSDDYHGMFDEVIVRGGKNLRSIPAASGIPFASVENVIVLQYGSSKALEVISRQSDEIAAVLVEPVQSRNLDLQPKAFLHELRQITEQKNIALIFDEVVTGFRSHIGGAQAYFGVSADLATYGKVVGGGMPIGVIAGSSRYMDALDGGQWQYGDASIPEAGVTYFAGTFVRHPLALAAAKATLTYLKQRGSGLQEELNAKTLDCVTPLRQYLQSLEVPMKILHFSSAFQFQYTGEVPFGGLIYPILRSKGIHIFEGRTWFFTAAHTKETINRVCEAFQESVDDMITGGFISAGRFPAERRPDAKVSDSMSVQMAPPVPGAKLGRCPDGNPAWFIEDPDRKGKFLKVG